MHGVFFFVDFVVPACWSPFVATVRSSAACLSCFISLAGESKERAEEKVSERAKARERRQPKRGFVRFFVGS